MADLSNTKDITTVDSTPSVAITDKIYINKGGKLQQVSLATAIESKIDSSLSKSKFAADAKATKDAISKVDSDIKAQNPISETIFSNTVTFSPTAYGNAIPEQIEGYIKQDTTKGAQLFDAKTVLSSQIQSKVLTCNNDGSVTLDGEITGSNRNFTIQLSAGTYYFNEKDKIFHTLVNGDDLWNKPYTFETDTTIKCYIANGEYGNKKIYPMINKGDSPLSIEPYTGRQPSPNPDYPQIVHGVGDMGFFDGELVLGAWNDSNGTFSPDNDLYVSGSNIIPCKPNDQIIIEYGVQFRATWIIWVNKDGSFISSQLFQNVKRCTAVAPTNCYGFKFSISEKSSVANVEATKSILVLINDKYAVCVKSKGKNLLDFEGFLNSRGSQYTKCGDRYRITGTGSAYSNPILLSDEDEDFTLTGSVTSESGNGYSVQLLNNAGDTVAFIKDDTKKASGKGCKIRLNYVDAGAGVYEDIMVEKGTSHDKYIPYQSTTTYIPVDYPLFEGDKIVRRNGEYKLLRKWGFKTYDGSDDEDWKINYIAGSEAQNAVYNVYIGDMANDAKKERYVPCNYFWSPAMGYYLNTTYVSVTGNYNIIISPDMKIDTDQKWKDWLKTHIMYCAYELATPTEEPLSSEAMKALYSIMACDEETELTIVGVPSDAEIQNQFLLPRNEDGALNTTAYCTAKRNEIALEELVAQSLDARVNKLEVDNESLNLQTLIVE